MGRLLADPVDPSLRAAVLEDARTAARTFNIAADALDNVGKGLRFEASDAAAQVNGLAESPRGNGAAGGSVLLAVIGELILLAGVGVGLYARYILRK